MDLGDLVISLRLRTEALEKGLEQTQRKLSDSEKAVKEQAKAIKEKEREMARAAQAEVKAAQEAAKAQQELQGAYTRSAAVATVSLAAIVAAVAKGIQAFNEYTSTMKGFENQIKATGQSVTEAKQAISDLTGDGLISESQTAAAIKNLVNYGFSVEKASKTIQALKDTAVDNRQAHYSLGEAVKVTTEGIRMENSTLSDAAGIQKNIAKMKEEYAKSINKTVDALTAAEKAEAIYSGVLAESVANTGRASEYAAELGGKLSSLDAQSLKLSQTFGGSLAPVVASVITPIQKFLSLVTSLMQSSPALTAAFTTMAAALTALIAVIGGVIAAKMAWAATNRILGVSLATLALNPIVLGLTALAGVVAFVTVKKQKAKEETERLRQAEEEYQKVVEHGIDLSQVGVYEEKIAALEKLQEEHRKATDAIAAFNQETEDIIVGKIDPGMKNRANEAFELADALKAVEKQFKEAGTSAERVAEEIETYTRAVKKAKIGTSEQVTELAKQVALQNREAIVIENLLKQYNSAKKGSSEWSSAQKQLADMFPQFSSAIGINEEAIQGLLIVKKQEVATAWASVQAKANEILLEKKREVMVREAAIAAVEAGAKWLFGMENAEDATRRAREEVARLKGEVVSLEALASTDPSKLPGIPVVENTAPKETSYQNKALDDAYRLLEHKKRLDQLTLADELKTLEQIKAKHVKTNAERMEIEERLYDVRKQIGDKSLEDALKSYDRAKARGLLNENDEIVRLNRIKRLYADDAEERQRLDDMIFDATMRKKEVQKQREADTVNETARVYQEALEDRLLREELTAEQRFDLERDTHTAIIAEYEAYLQSVLQDDKYTAAEKEKIQSSITGVIRENINERLKLEKDYQAEVLRENINAIDDLSKGIQSALRSKYSEERNAEEGRIRGLLSENEEWKRGMLDIAKSTYDDRLKAAQKAADAEIAMLDQVYGAQIKAIQDELATLEQAEKQKTRAELDADDEQKLARLRAKLEYERDEQNKTSLQKEINKVLADQAKRHEQEQLSDKKDALKEEEKTLKERLKEETEQIKQQLADKKEMLATDRDEEIARINEIALKTKESLDEQMKEMKQHFDDLLKARSLQAEAEKLLIDNQQQEIVALIEGYGESYQIAGQTLGEKLFSGFKGRVDQINGLIDDINKRIDDARNAALTAMDKASSSQAPSTKSSAPVANGGKTVTVNNTFTAPVTSPSDVSRAAQKTAQQLAGF